MEPIPLALTYDDVLVVPRRSSFISRTEANIKTRLTRRLSLHIPIVSANMDTVTESEMAIALARLGGIGIVHRFMSIEDNIEEIKRVKRAENFIISEPYTIQGENTIAQAKEFIEQHGVSGLLVTSIDGKLLGVLSGRDLLFARNDTSPVSDVMTPRMRLIVGTNTTSLEEARHIFIREKVEKLPLVDTEDRVIGLITSRDLEHHINYPHANRDPRGRLVVGGSVGVHGDYLERAQALIQAGVDVLVIDIAHGHSDIMFRAIEKLRAVCGDTELIAGNVATAQAAYDLCEAGVDAIKVGIGPGSTCITRIVTGCGMPQLTAVMETAKIAKRYNIPVIADGGIQKPGDLVKAIGAGADTVMIGGLFAGVHESPGVIMSRDGKKYKIYRGSASFAVAQRRKAIHQEGKDLGAVVAEGVESVVPYKGPIEELLREFIGGLKSGMSYTDSHTIEELQHNVSFIRITHAGLRESGPHDIHDIH